MILTLLASLPFLLAQDSEPIPPTPFDRVIELEITASDEPAIEGHGPTAFAEYEVQFDGTLHVWTRSELDLFVQVDDAAETRRLASDDNSGGGMTPYLRLEVQQGDWLAILVATRPGSSGPVELHLIATPETDAVRAAAKAARDARRNGSRLVDEGRGVEARAIMAHALPEALYSVGSDHPDLTMARAKLGHSLHDLGDLAGARALREAVLAARERTLPALHPQLLAAQVNLANSIHRAGDLSRARTLREATVAGFERTLPEDHPYLLLARSNLADSMSEMGDLTGARALQESVLAARERTLPEDDPNLILSRFNLATSMHQMGDLAEARALRENILTSCERLFPADHNLLIGARLSLAGSMFDMGELAEARALREAALSSAERTLPEDHSTLLTAQGNLADSMHAMGELAGARALREALLAARERSLPDDHPEVLEARTNLAISLNLMGDLAGTRALEESVLAASERVFPEDHPRLLMAQSNLAVTMEKMGDALGARALREAALDGYERSFPVDHPHVILARMNLANAMAQTGDPGRARELREAVVESYERSRPEDHPDLLRAQGNLAHSIQDTGDFTAARALKESVHAGYARILPEGHPTLLLARSSVASSMLEGGDLAEARALYESVLAGYERIRREGHPDLLRHRTNLAATMFASRDSAGIRALLPELIAGMRVRVLASLALAPRESRRTVADEDQRLSRVLSFGATAGLELERSQFELTETMRLVAAEAARLLAGLEDDSELAPILREAAEVRRKLNDLVAGAASDPAEEVDLSAELTSLSLRRDRLERNASRRLAERGVVTQSIETEQLSEALNPGDLAVGYRRVVRWEVDEDDRKVVSRPDHLIAHVLDADGALARIDLGPSSEIESLASAWRAALGAPIGSHGALRASDSISGSGTQVAAEIRGVALGFGARGEKLGAMEEDAGRVLRRLILDPVLAATTDDLKRLFVCADDLLFLLPLDALPLSPEGSGRVGDRLQIVNGVSFARLQAPHPPNAGEPSLLSMGGVDYDASGAQPENLSAASAPIEPDGTKESGDPTTRAAAGAGFQNLIQARHEAESIARLFEEAFEKSSALLTRKQTTKAALFESAPGKRYLHLATHGWFAPESVRSAVDAQPSNRGFARMGIEDRVTGLAPMTLCGLALAGANKGRDSLGRVPGILTAEELCSLDLSQCELAVLSACETNVGIRRAGQGIQSLQSALYAAGARTSITSLWKVDDAATRRLMEVFYTNLWIENMPKAEALWQAKQALRDEGHPPAHWAGWVLTGDPN